MSEFQWSPAMLSGSHYKEVSANPVGGPPVFNRTASVISKYKLPSEVFKIGGGHVDFDFYFAATASLKRQIHLGKIMPIQQIKWRHSNGTVLAECSNVAIQTSVVLPNLKLDEFASRTLTCCRYTQATIDTCSYGEMIHPVKKSTYMTQGDDGKGAVGAGSSYAYSATDGGYSVLPDLAGTTATPGVPSTGELAVATAVGSLAQNVANYFKCRVNFSDLIDSLLAYKKDMWLGNQESELEITWRNGENWGYEITGAATPSLDGSANITVVSPVLGSNGINVYIPVQQNQKIRDSVRAVWSAPDFSMLVPLQYVFSQSFAAAASNQSVSVPIMGSPGSRLLRCWVVANNPNAGSVFMSSNNLDKRVGNAGSNTTVLYNTIRTALGTQYLQDNALSVAKGEDYNYLREKLRGSAVQDWDTFRQFSFWVDNFTSGSPSYDWQEENKDMGGIENNGSLTYKVEMTLTNAAAVVLYVMYTLQMTLRMTSAGPVIV